MTPELILPPDPATAVALDALEVICQREGWSLERAKREIQEALRIRQHQKLQRAEVEQAEIAKDSHERRALGDDGKMDFQIHPDIYYHWTSIRGPRCWKDPAFVKWFLDRNPACRVKTVVPTTITAGIDLSPPSAA